MIIYLSEYVISNASIDMDSNCDHGGETQPINKKRKQGNAILILENIS